MLTADDKLAEIKRLCYRDDTARRFSRTWRARSQLLKSMSGEEERERAAVYGWMDCRRCDPRLGSQK